MSFFTSPANDTCYDHPSVEGTTLQDVRNKVETEGLDYALTLYSDWETVPDLEFQDMLWEFRSARERIKEYLLEETSGESEDL